MNINIDLSDEQCQLLLDAYDYVVVDKDLYFEDVVGLYDNYDDKTYKSVSFKVAYKRGEVPSELKEHMPMLSECRQYLYNKVIEKLFVKKYFEKLF